MQNYVFRLNNLDEPPLSSDIYLWADYIELRCLVSLDQEISKADIIEIKRASRDVYEQPEEFERDFDAESSALSDRMTLNADDWYRHLKYREGSFRHFYPFSVSSNGDVLRTKKPTTGKHLFYIFLLLSSSIRYVGRRHHMLTRSFEKLSREALRNCLQRNAEIYVFGTSDGGQGRYRGNIFTKIEKLSQDIHENLLAKQVHFSRQSSADYGLDIVGWIPTGDNSSSNFLVFGQCACTLDWVEKQHSSNLEKWRRVIDFAAPPTNVIFIPFCFRGSDGDWVRPLDIHNSFLIDRLRFIHFMSAKYHLLQDQQAFTAVKDVLKQRDPVFG